MQVSTLPGAEKEGLLDRCRHFLGGLLGGRPSLSRLASEQPRRNGRRTVAPDVRASLHEDGAAILHISTGQVFLFNSTGSRIWQGVVRGMTAGAIAEEISIEYDTPRELVERHTSAFLAELDRHKLVVSGGGERLCRAGNC